LRKLLLQGGIDKNDEDRITSSLDF
jgi:hypothetical protein